MRETNAQRQNRATIIVDRLKSHYPDAHCALNFANPLELLVATILSAQCTDERVNIVTKELFKAYRRAKDYAEAPPEALEQIIRSTGFFRAKAKSLRGMGQALVSKHSGEVPKDMEALTHLPGVGRKTANVVLGNAFAIASGVVVDTHVARLSYRLGLTRQTQPEKIERDLEKLVPRHDWIMFSHWLIWHGRKICKARKPACQDCVLKDVCPQRGVD